ncbi:MAG: hypothetical protein AAFR51_09835 [Pseudomonadota bacterium]
MRRIITSRPSVIVTCIAVFVLPSCAQTALEGEYPQSQRDEMGEKLSQMEIDPNSAEARRMRQNQIKFLKKADSNNDDILTEEELAESIRRRFDQMDRNGDGEFDFGDKPSVAPRARFERAVSPVIEQLDEDGSGGVSILEFQAQSMRGFEAFDAAGTGSVNLNEMIAAIESIGQK